MFFYPLFQNLCSLEKPSNLKSGYEELSKHYRKQGGKNLSLSDQNAYLWARLPATEYVINHLLAKIDHSIETVADIGCGVGIGFLQALNRWPNIKKAILVDQANELLDLNKKLIKSEKLEHVLADYHSTKLQNFNFSHSVDLTILSYVLNEFEEKDQKKIIEKCWAQTNKVFLIIMPGTPKFFKNLITIRDWFINRNAHIVAPCTHSNRCPLENVSSDWCHFSVRVPRSSAHRYIKNATLNYEDEKFCYLIIEKEKSFSDSHYKRIIKKPRHHTGHSVFDFCTDQGLTQETFTKKNTAHYKEIKKLTWGDCL